MTTASGRSSGMNSRTARSDPQPEWHGRVLQQLLPRVLLAVGDMLDLIDGASGLTARRRHRITPGRSAPRHSGRVKPPAHLACKG